MTCQSSLLIGVLNELCLPVCTLRSDLQLPWQFGYMQSEPLCPTSQALQLLLMVEDKLYLKRVYSNSSYFTLRTVCTLCVCSLTLLMFSMLTQISE